MANSLKGRPGPNRDWVWLVGNAKASDSSFDAADGLIEVACVPDLRPFSLIEEIHRIAAAQSGTRDPSAAYVNSGPTALALPGLSAVQAVTRRISRETLRLCAVIEKGATELDALLCKMGSRILVIRTADGIDSISLRVLARLVRDGRQSPVTVVCCFDRDPTIPTPEEAELGLARSTLFAAVRNATAPDVRIASAGVTAVAGCIFDSFLRQDRPVDFSDFITKLSDSISFLTYDRAYGLCQSVLRDRLSDDERARVYRFKATIDCNLGFLGATLDSLAKALATAQEPCLRSQILYLKGLVHAKRMYDVDSARAFFEEGKRVFAAEQGTPSMPVALELSWQDNGIALIESMMARLAKDEDKATWLDRALNRELSALKRISPYRSIETDYLKFNIIANCVLVFEMKGQPRDALRFFEMVFSKYLNHGADMSAEFSMSFNYRMGTLYLKLGQLEQAQEHLEASLASACRAGIDYSIARVRLALTILCLRSKQWHGALDYAVAGLESAAHQGDKSLLKDYAATLALEAEFPSEVRQRAQESLGRAMRAAEIMVVPASRPRLSPKLPAYNPLVDLLPSPEVDLNKAFVAAALPTQGSQLAEARA